jgi:hypothetical protein
MSISQVLPSEKRCMSRQTHMDYQDPLNDPGSASRHTCPQCGQSLIRIRRRFIDRLTSIVQPVHRFRCRNHTCQWQGNISVKAPAAADTPDADPDS